MLISIYCYYLLVVYMEEVNVITVKVPSEMKKQMKQTRINWSNYIRECVQQKIDEQKRTLASAKLDEIRKRTNPTSTHDVVTWIRSDRER
jgi:hypothetical protein